MTNAERIRPITNEELIQALRNCSSVDGECEGCPMYDRKDVSDECINEVVRLAADRLEALVDQLHYAQAERDVVTKRMIAMEIEGQRRRAPNEKRHVGPVRPRG